ncbi:MAG: MBL fold metallo-hydrolase [Sediminibacterium sp.]|nr:MBL fold metallo-hydrolase [Sediminibacterium sp.]
MQIIPLSEGTFSVNQQKIFEHYVELNDSNKNNLVVDIQPFLIITNKDIILLDTGLGLYQHNQLQIFENLRQHNINPLQITKVLVSHLHTDHCSGMFYNSKDNNDMYLSFPNAMYYIRKDEYQFALTSNSNSYKKNLILQLNNFNKNIQWIYEEEGFIDDYIKFKKTSGHAPNHQVYWIYENNQTIFYGGDEAPQFNQLLFTYKAKYDFNPSVAANYRKQWKEEGILNNWIFLFYHDLKNKIKSLNE